MKARVLPALLLAGLFLILVLSPSGQRAAATRPMSQKYPTAAVVTRKPPAATVSAAAVDDDSTAAKPLARITHVSIVTAGDGKTVVDVGATRPVKFTRFNLQNPPRLVVDLQDTEMGRFERVYPKIATGALKDVRAAQFQVTPSSVTRVVADLAGSEPAQIDSGPDGVRIVFVGPAVGSQPQQNIAAEPGRSQVHAPARPVDLATPIEVSPRPLATPRRSNLAISSNREIAALAKPVSVNWEDAGELAPHPALIAAQPIAVEGPPPPVDETMASVMPVRATHALLPRAEQALRAAEVLSGTNPVQPIPVVSSITSAPGDSQAPPRYTGKLISLDLKGVDIRDFFRLIHQVSGLNIIVDSDVTGKVTMALDDVPWDQALDLVLKNNGLGKVLEGNVLRIATVKTLTSEAEEQSTLRDAKIESEPLVTVFRRLKYAHAADQKPSTGGSSIGGGGGGSNQTNTTPIPGVATILKGFQKGSVLTARGNVVADPRDNAVIITDVASQIPVIESVINELDTKSKQVSIQVRVILANSDFTRSLSAVLSGAFRSAQGHTLGAGGTGQGITGVAPTSSPLPLLSAVTQPGSVAASGFGAFSITTQAARYAINAAITAAETHDQARTISRPTIVTQDNVLGEVQQGVQIPIQTDINNTIAIQYVNATLMLSVTPQVTVDNKIFLKIYVNNASIGSISVLAGPTINTQEATTQVLVPDGGTVVFGGITVTARGRSATYVPLLGSIPVIGNLFKSSAVNDQNQELLFFVSPTILPG